MKQQVYDALGTLWLSSRVWIGLFLLSAVVRTIGVDWGGTHGDEHIDVSSRVLAGEISPSNYIYMPFGYYMNAIFIAIMAAGGVFLGIIGSPSEFKQLYFSNPLPFYLAIRANTIFWTSLLAPAGAWVALRLGLDRRAAIVVGLLLALLPINVGWAHIAKPDIPMTTGVMLTVAAAFAVLDDPKPWWRSVLLGVAVAIAVSCRPSAIFFLVPFMLATIGLGFREQSIPPRDFGISVGIGLAAAAGAFFVFNIGLFLDFANFLEYQRLQSQISARSSQLSGVLDGLATLFSPSSGAGPLLFLAFLALPAVDRGRLALLGYGSVIAGFVLTVGYAGDRLPAYLLMPLSAMIVVLGATTLLKLAEEQGALRWVGVGGLALAGLLFLGGSASYTLQALRQGPSATVADFIRRSYKPEETKILTMHSIDLVPSREALLEYRGRHRRLAQKYDVQLPPMVDVSVKATGDYHITQLPFMVGGLEFSEEEDFDVVKPYVWPRQKEEWTLDYWLGQGFDVVIAMDESRRLASKKVPPIEKNLHEEIRKRCKVEFQDKAGKPFFEMPSMTVYRCAGAAESPL